MEQLINSIMERAGVSRGEAEAAAGLTINWLKDKLPVSIASEIDSALLGAAISEVAGGIESKTT